MSCVALVGEEEIMLGGVLELPVPEVGNREVLDD